MFASVSRRINIQQVIVMAIHLFAVAIAGIFFALNIFLNSYHFHQ
jgi:hypothetical protein